MTVCDRCAAIGRIRPAEVLMHLSDLTTRDMRSQRHLCAGCAGVVVASITVKEAR